MGIVPTSTRNDLGLRGRVDYRCRSEEETNDMYRMSVDAIIAMTRVRCHSLRPSYHRLLDGDELGGGDGFAVLPT